MLVCIFTDLDDATNGLSPYLSKTYPYQFHETKIPGTQSGDLQILLLLSMDISAFCQSLRINRSMIGQGFSLPSGRVFSM